MSSPPRWQAILVMALDGFGNTLNRSSQTFLIEQALCRAFYTSNKPAVIRPDGSVPEEMCKAKGLQAQVAPLSSMVDLSILLVGLLVTPLFTRLASVMGKRQVLLINSTSYLLRMVWYAAVFYFHTFFKDARWVLVSCVFDVFGGGTPVREILLWLYIAQSGPQDEMTGAFNITRARLIAFMSLGTFIGACLLKRHVWLLCSLVIANYAFVFLAIYLFPPDPPTCKSDSEEGLSGERDALLSPPPPIPIPVASDPLLTTVDTSADTQTQPTQPRRLSRTLLLELSSSLDLIVQIFRNPLVLRVSAIFFTTTLAMAVAGTSQQWASSTFHRSLADVDSITSMEQILSAAVLLALPVFSRHVLRPHLSTKQRTDFFIIVASLLVGVGAVSVMAIAPSLLVYAVGVAVSVFGVGMADSLRSFASTALCDDEAVQMLYMSIRTAQSLAGAVGTPLWAGVFLLILSRWGLPPGVLWGVNGVVLFCALLLTVFLRRYR